MRSSETNGKNEEIGLVSIGVVDADLVLVKRQDGEKSFKLFKERRFDIDDLRFHHGRDLAFEPRKLFLGVGIDRDINAGAKKFFLGLLEGIAERFDVLDGGFKLGIPHKPLFRFVVPLGFELAGFFAEIFERGAGVDRIYENGNIKKVRED